MTGCERFSAFRADVISSCRESGRAVPGMAVGVHGRPQSLRSLRAQNFYFCQSRLSLMLPRPGTPKPCAGPTAAGRSGSESRSDPPELTVFADFQKAVNAKQRRCMWTSSLNGTREHLALCGEGSPGSLRAAAVRCPSPLLPGPSASGACPAWACPGQQSWESPRLLHTSAWPGR